MAFVDNCKLKAYTFRYDGHHRGVEDFRSFLEFEVYPEFGSDNSAGMHKACLLDLIEAWLIHGNAVRVCGTFENYLVVVVSIIACWVDDLHTRGTTFDSQTFIDQVRGPREPAPEGRPWVVEETMPMSRFEYAAYRHGALSRTLWDLAVAESHNQNNDQL